MLRGDGRTRVGWSLRGQGGPMGEEGEVSRGVRWRWGHGRGRWGHGEGMSILTLCTPQASIDAVGAWQLTG